MSVASLTECEWPFQEVDEHQLARHQDKSLHRVVPATPHSVSIPLVWTFRCTELRWFMYVPAKLDFSDLTDILAL